MSDDEIHLSDEEEAPAAAPAASEQQQRAEDDDESCSSSAGPPQFMRMERWEGALAGYYFGCDLSQATPDNPGGLGYHRDHRGRLKPPPSAPPRGADVTGEAVDVVFSSVEEPLRKVRRTEGKEGGKEEEPDAPPPKPAVSKEPPQPPRRHGPPGGLSKRQQKKMAQLSEEQRLLLSFAVPSLRNAAEAEGGGKARGGEPELDPEVARVMKAQKRKAEEAKKAGERREFQGSRGRDFAEPQRQAIYKVYLEERLRQRRKKSTEERAKRTNYRANKPSWM
eukprot:Hpha_TRINITY_DN15165_c3_g8::TRINITY_DN15165_c3_g8_i1::g.126602::m.126602